MSFNIKDAQNLTLELPYIYYHGYTVKLNNEKIDNFESENGFLAINVNQDGLITVEYTGTILEKVGFVVSSLTLIILVIYLIIKNRRKNSKIRKIT